MLHVTRGAESHAHPEDTMDRQKSRGSTEQERFTSAENIRKPAHFSRPLKRDRGDEPEGRAGQAGTALVSRGDGAAHSGTHLACHSVRRLWRVLSGPRMEVKVSFLSPMGTPSLRTSRSTAFV